MLFDRDTDGSSQGRGIINLKYDQPVSWAELGRDKIIGGRSGEGGGGARVWGTARVSMTLNK